MVSSVSSTSSAYDTTDLFRNLFKKLDKDGDGSVTKAELKSALQSSDSSVSDSTVSALFNKLDSDGNGSISESELQSAAQQMFGPPPGGQSGMSVSDMAQSLFQAADTSGTGSITESELVSAMQQQLQTQNGSNQSTSSVSELAQKLFAAADTNGTGSVTESQLESAMKQQQQQMQADSNHLLSATATSYDSTGNSVQQAFQSLFSLLA